MEGGLAMPRFGIDGSGRLAAAGTAVFLSLARGPRRPPQPRSGFLRRSAALAMFAAALAVQPEAARAQDRLPQEFNPETCHQLVLEAGRMIAWARWQENYPLDKTLSGQFREGTPEWMIDLVEGWIVDAYQWQATDEQIRQSAAELGYAGELPRAEQLNAQQTIAIWMWRIAHQCDLQQI
jgi:hypothetical protein